MLTTKYYIFNSMWNEEYVEGVECVLNKLIHGEVFCFAEENIYDIPSNRLVQYWNITYMIWVFVRISTEFVKIISHI